MLGGCHINMIGRVNHSRCPLAALVALHRLVNHSVSADMHAEGPSQGRGIQPVQSSSHGKLTMSCLCDFRLEDATMCSPFLDTAQCLTAALSPESPWNAVLL